MAKSNEQWIYTVSFVYDFYAFFLFILNCVGGTLLCIVYKLIFQSLLGQGKKNGVFDP